MRLSKLVGERTKETPSSAQVKSHAFLLRAGFIKQVSNGIFTLLAPAKRVVRKIENIIREEMDALDGQEVLFPVVMPKELWAESGRYDSIGEEMVRFKDRTGHDMLLGMTHEEAAVHACRNFVKSYDQLPFMIYQIQTKFRDEARARAGLIRVKEFTMKDAYSFHETQEDLNEYYYKQLDAYNRIFSRIGMKNFVSVKSDTGMMGGNVAHEFMLLTEIGEDSIAICDNCDYRANVEVAAGILDLHETKVEELKEVFTGDAKDIAEICSILNVEPWQTCKAVSYAIKGDEKKSVLAFVRGDLEVNESKLKNLVGAEVAPKDLSNDEELLAGNIGPVGLKLCDTIVVFDKSLEQCASLVCGANKPKMHYVGFNIERDYGVVEFSDITKVKDLEVCKICGKGHLHIKRGIEIGNIFNLGNKYTKSMNMTVHGRDGKEFNPIMGCYGIGVGRALASVVEESCDEKGLVWPMSIAPWQVCICPLRLDNENVKNISEKLYDDFTQSGIEVIYDDRDISAGIKFADSELMGIPLRVVISPRSLEKNQVELSYRKSGEKEMVDLPQIIAKIKQIII